jgi:xanthine dehydrogenase YagT iron-sulfur-binding subunit
MSNRSTEGFAPKPAPPTLRLDSGRTLDLRSFAGQPVVLGFWDAGWMGDLRADDPAWVKARAELRGLGAVLLVLCDGGLWLFSPDDELEVIAPPGSLSPDDVGALRAWVGHRQIGGGIFILDGQLEVRAAQAVMPGSLEAPTPFAALVDALAAAGRTLAHAQATPFTLSRRQFVVSSLVVALAAAFADACATAPAPVPEAAAAAGEFDLSLNVNGSQRTVRADARLTLLDALRERLNLPGTKKGCDQGQCGACTVLIEGRRVNACLTLAVMVQDVPIVTIEGLSPDGSLHPLQAAFVAEDGFQCGYCTSGQIMSAVGLRRECRARGEANAVLGDDELREGMSGNLCRCGAYPNIRAAINRAWKET